MPNLDWLPPAILDISKPRALQSNEFLFRQGEPATAIYRVEEGRVRLVRYTIDDHLAVLHTAGPGEFFAEAALFTDSYHCDAVAAGAAHVRGYPKREVVRALRDPDLAKRYMALLAQELYTLRTRLEQRNIRSARDRIVQHLALHADAQSGAVHLNGTLMDLAGEIGLSHEALYRNLAALEDASVITRAKDSIVLLRAKAV